jgi:hypothetical protein
MVPLAAFLTEAKRGDVKLAARSTSSHCYMTVFLMNCTIIISLICLLDSDVRRFKNGFRHRAPFISQRTQILWEYHQKTNCEAFPDAFPPELLSARIFFCEQPPYVAGLWREDTELQSCWHKILDVRGQDTFHIPHQYGHRLQSMDQLISIIDLGHSKGNI